MNALSVLKVYLSMNLLLITSFIFFFGLRIILGHAKFTASHRNLIHIAQILIFTSVLAPLALHTVPEKNLPSIAWKEFQPPSEEAAQASDRKTALPKTQILSGGLEKPNAEDSNLIDRTLHWLNSESNAPTSATFLIVLVLGFLGFSVRFLKNLKSLHNLLKEANLVRKVGRVRIVVADGIAVPFSTRLWRVSWVALPTKILEKGNDYKLAVKHELQHHRQLDTLWASFVEGLVCLFYANPAIFLWKREISELQEFSCDEALIGHKGISSHDYGSCLVRVAETALGVREMYVGTTCMAAASKNPFYKKSFLRRRIEMFTSHHKSNGRRGVGFFIGTATLVFTIAIAFGAEKSLRPNHPGINPGILVVDPAIQKIAESALDEAIVRENAKSGFAIVADPQTGKILAVANIDKTGKRKGHWALSQVLEPASLAKTLVAAQAIQSGLTTPQDTHACENGTYAYGGRIYHDWKPGGWDHMTTEETIVSSGDICSIKIGEKVGAIGLRKMLADFGFGPGGSASSFPEARIGTLPPLPNAADFIPSVSAGYGYLVSSLEIIQAYGAIANGGNLLAPKLANDSQTEVVRRVLSPDSAEKMKAILQQVVLKGTGKANAASTLYTTAGKTATSYIPDLTQWDLVEGKNFGNFAGFVGFAPVNDPKVEVYVGILDPSDKTGAHGSTHAAPVFKKITEEVLKQMKVSPDQS